jgi:hypothetical protein
LKEELKIKQRQRELNDWAMKDYGVKIQCNYHSPLEMISTYRSSFTSSKVEHVPAFQMIENETDFIFKVRNKWIHQRNYINAVKIQSWMRMLRKRTKYRKLRKEKLGAAIYI